METEKGQITRIYNGEIITPERNFGVGTVLIAEGKIIGIEPGNYEVPGSIGHDAHGGYIAPGFIDLQDRKSTRLNSSHRSLSRMPSSA